MIKVLLLLVTAMLCAIPALHAQIIDITGSTTVKAFIEPAAAAFRLKHAEIVINISGGGSGAGAASIIDGRAMIGMMSRELSPSEKERMKDIDQVRVGYDALTLVISKPLFHQGSVHALKRSDIAAIYRGEIRNWQDVGGPDRQILLIDRKKKSGTRQVFVTYMLKDRLAKHADNAVIVGSNRDIKKLIAVSDQAIGFLPFGQTDKQTHAIDLIDQGKVFSPDRESIHNGSYPMARSLYVLHAKDAPAYAHAFVQFLLSDEGQRILEQSGYVPLK